MARTLTKKQKEFVETYADTGNGTLAAKKAYDIPQDNNNLAAVIASENLTKPKIIDALKELGFDSDNAKRVVGEILNKEFAEDTDRLKAAKLIFEVNGDMAPEKHLIVTKKIISVDE